MYKVLFLLKKIIKICQYGIGQAKPIFSVDHILKPIFHLNKINYSQF